MTNIDPTRSDADDSQGLPMLGRIVLVFGAGVGLLFLGGIAIGYISVMIERDDPQFRDFAIITAIVAAIGGIGYAALRLWRRMTPTKQPPNGPGEARTRQRQRRQMLYFGVAVMIGGIIGVITGVFDRGDGSLLSNDWDKLSLDPPVAILLAVLVLIGFAILPIYGFRTIDEMKREHNLIGFAGGCTAVMAGFPMWAVLHAGGMGSAPHPFGVWLLGFAGMMLSYLYAWWQA
ncbi:MAG: hypothetical protein EAY70_01710 [Sphingomonadales bacterium]|nr:MAG: hypothetical protein EAY70_01710 [Sphingomonadales bacterium]